MIRLNVEAIVDLARDFLSAEQQEEFRRRLEQANKSPSRLVQQDVAQLQKALSEAYTQGVALADLGAILQIAVEFVGRLWLFQFDMAYAAWRRLLNAFGHEDDVIAEMLARYVSGQDSITSRALPDGLYAALSFAAVLACETPDCGQRKCWPTRRWGCDKMDEYRPEDG